jgi:hypothetical protein
VKPLSQSKKAPSSKLEDSSDEEESTDEETAFHIRNFKKFLKRRSFKKGGDDKRKSQRRCYQCGEYGHFIAECPKKKNKEEEEKKYKDKSKEYKKRFQGHAHVGQEWDSSDEDDEPKKKGMATLAMEQGSSSPRLFNNNSDDEDDSHFCLMARGSKVSNSSTSSNLTTSSSSTPSNDIDNLDDEEEIEANMIKQFGKKGFKEIKRLMEKLEKKKGILHEQEDLLVLEKERNLALEKSLAEANAKVEKLSIDLSLANDSNKRMSKENTLANESLATLKSKNSELQESLSCLTVKFKDLEVNYNALWESTKAKPKATLDSNSSTSKGCSRCYKFDISAYETNLARLEEVVKGKDKELDRLNMLVKQGYMSTKPTPKVTYKQGRSPKYGDGLGYYKDSKANGRKVVNGHDVPLWNKGGYLNAIMDIAHGASTSTTTQDKGKGAITTKGSDGVKSPSKEVSKVVAHEPSRNYTCDYIVTIDHNGKMVVKYVGAYTRKTMLRKSVWVPKVYASNLHGPKSFWVPKPKA